MQENFYKITYEVNKAFAQIDFDLTDPTVPKYLDFEQKGLLPSISKLPRYKMVHGGTPMDLINSPAISNCLVISNSVRDYFNTLTMPLHQYFDVTFIYRKKLFDNYKALYIPRNPKFLEMIDWDKSEFYKTQDYHNIILEKYTFRDWDEMVNFDKSFWGTEFGFLRKLKIKYSGQYDIVRFGYHGFPPGYICTEKVQTEIENRGFTGFAFEPVEEGVFI
jgi:hypothetical protein